MQWILLSVCLVVLFDYAFGLRLGIISAAIFLASIGLLIWALNRSEGGPKK